MNKNKEMEMLQEAPLGYWEEASYMQVIPNNNDMLMPRDIVERIKNVEGILFDKVYMDDEKHILYVKLKYKDEDYEIGIFPSDFNFSEMYINRSFYFTEEEIEKIRSAKLAVTIFMNFKEKVKESFHLQLKIAVAIVPDLIGLVDESAERVLPAKWVKLAAKSKVTPGPSDLFSVQAVYDEKENEVWLHTHGLCRCGLTELEILKSNKENYSNHNDLINTYASFIIDKKGKFDPRKEVAYLGILSDRRPVVVICKSWTEAIHQYDKLTIGGINDRQNSHNTRTSPIFLYKNEDDLKNNRLSKVTEYDSLWGENPIFFFSDEETDRMKKLARERFDYVQKAVADKANKAVVKISLPTDNGSDVKVEHIWFELLEFDGDKFKAKLTQEPYDVKDIKVGDERWFTVNDVTDWIIYTPKFRVNPSEVYLL